MLFSFRILALDKCLRSLLAHCFMMHKFVYLLGEHQHVELF